MVKVVQVVCMRCLCTYLLEMSSLSLLELTYFVLYVVSGGMVVCFLCNYACFNAVLLVLYEQIVEISMAFR